MKQSGFTLIELIVVIVVLGILAATALPKIASLDGDARAASVRAARGALAASAAMIHGKWLLHPQNTVTVEGTTVDIVNGYPKGTLAFAAAAGLSTNDYKIEMIKDELRIIPLDIAHDKEIVKLCFVRYEAPSAPNRAPSIDLAGMLVCK
jgi:MSHA pilin protein MshA